MADSKRPIEGEAEKSLKRIQDIDPVSLARTADMPQSANFGALVEPAKRLIDIYNLIPLAVLPDLPDQHLTVIRDRANSLFSVIEQVRNFNLETGNIAATRAQVADQLRSSYADTWGVLQPYVGYAAARVADFQRLEREGRAAVQSINDRASELVEQLASIKSQAEQALDAAKRAAAEQGVSQQAVYFREEADEHNQQAEIWQKRTFWFAIGLGGYALLTVFVHKWNWLRPADTAESAQLLAGKILLFAVISYLLLLSARNFLSHKHNAIVNKHRQNALMTFNAIAEAAKDDTAKDIILTHAAACIFSPQETGYAKASTSPEGASLAQAMAGLLAKSESKPSGG